ncbi:MAG TPA: helix-turn-helix transcriptional regulator [Planctomycetota bacterium]|nr:helix-turn-helix transcriptional regulator [Planctomycetota bacterium]
MRAPDTCMRLPIDRLAPYVRIAARVAALTRGLGERILADHELLFFQKGRGRFTIAGREHEIVPGALFILPPGVAHAFSAPEAGRPYAFLSVHFDPWFIPGRERIGHLGSADPELGLPAWLADGGEVARLPPRVAVRDPRLYERLFDAVHRRFPMRDLVLTGAALPDAPDERLRLAGAVIDLIAFVLAEAAAPAGRLTPRQLEAVDRAAAILAGHAGAMPVAALARRVGLSRPHLARCFVLRHGIPPVRFHLRQRIARAQDELIRNRRPIKTVADLLGFASVHQFTRSFARVAGLPPAAWRALRERGADDLVPIGRAPV